MTILTSYIFPPIPFRGWDWLAWVDGEEDGPTGTGATEAEAVAELKERLEQE